MKVYSPVPLDAVSYHQRGDGAVDVRLRKNFESITRIGEETTSVEYSADEIYFVTRKPKQYIVDNFDDIWRSVARNKMTKDERIAELEAANTDLELAVCDLYEMTLGGGING